MNTLIKNRHLLRFGSVMIVTWVIGTFLFVYFWPHVVNNVFKRAIVNQGFGSGPIPINTLYTEPQALFAEPLQTPLPPALPRKSHRKKCPLNFSANPMPG